MTGYAGENHAERLQLAALGGWHRPRARIIEDDRRKGPPQALTLLANGVVDRCPRCRSRDHIENPQTRSQRKVA